MTGEIFVAQGDITQLDAHVIVCTTSPAMAGTGKMHPAFRQNVPGFAEAFADLARHRAGTARTGDVFWLPLKESSTLRGVAVVIATGVDPEDSARTAVDQAARRACDELRKLEVEGPWLIALPPIRFGAGGDRDRRVHSAQVQLEAAQEVLRSLPAEDPLTDLVFVTYLSDDYQIYLDARARLRQAGVLPGTAEKITVPSRLIDDLRSGECVLFVGSGLSLGAGLPGWGSLIARLAEKLGLPRSERQDLDYYLDLAQWYVESEAGQQEPLAGLLAQFFGETARQVRPTLAHYLLMSLPLCYVITTNYDDLLERSLRALRRYPVEVIDQSHVPQTGARDGIHVVKFHGDPRHPDSLVLTRDDYDALFDKQPAMKLLLEGLLLNQTFFFVGYSLRDPDFRQIYTRIAAMLPGAKRPAFATTFEDSEFQRKQWKNKQVELITTPGAGTEQPRHLLIFMDRLAELVAGREHLLLGQDKLRGAVPATEPLAHLRQALREAGRAVEEVLASSHKLTPPEVEHLEGVLRFLTVHGWRPEAKSREQPGPSAAATWEQLARRTTNSAIRRRVLIQALAQTDTFDDAERIRKELNASTAVGTAEG